MNSKRLFKKMLSLFLVLMLALCTLGTGVLAEDKSEGGGDVSQTTESGSDTGSSGSSEGDGQQQSGGGGNSDTGPASDTGGSEAGTDKGGNDSSTDAGDTAVDNTTSDTPESGGDNSVGDQQKETAGNEDNSNTDSENKSENQADSTKTDTDTGNSSDNDSKPVSGTTESTGNTGNTGTTVDSSTGSTENSENNSLLSNLASGVSNITSSLAAGISGILSSEPSAASYEGEDGSEVITTINTAPGASELTADSSNLTSGYYYLSGNVQLTTNITIPENTTVTINLNGHSLKGNGNGSVITVKGKLIIMDTDDNKGSITGGTGTTVSGVTRGGGIYIEGGGEVTLQGGVIGNPEFTLEGKSANESDLTDLAYGNKADDGGGVYVANNAIFNMNGGSINGNIAKKRSGITYGGGAIQSYGTVNISGGTLSNNAGCVGGALEVSSGTFDISGGTFSNNRAFTDDQNTGSTGNGGAVYIKSVTGKTVKIENAVFEDNIALRFGGAMEFFCDLSVTFDNVTVKNNSATLDGGGIVVDRSGTLTISSGTTFSGNKSRYGGGICMYSADSKLIVNGGIFTGNSAESGGGIYTRAKYVTIESGSITNNTASGNGGGLYVTTNVTESSTADITASVKINGGSITGNTATGSGGGVYVTGNRATNKTTNVVYIGMVNVTITGGSVTNNTATVDGGGVYVTSSGTVAVTVEGGSITGNYAVNGGGIAVVPQDNAEAAVVIGTYGCTEESGHTHPDISKNTASGDGGGVYISSGSATMYCGTISSNKLADGTSSDVSQTGGAFETAGGTIETDPIVTGGEYKDTSESGGNVGDEAYYKVSYYSNYTGSNESNTVTVNTVTVIGNKTSVSVTLPDSKKFTSDGYYIIGWSTTTDSESTSSKYDTGETVVLWSLLNIADDSAESTENTTVEGNGTEADPYIISFYAVWAEEAVEVGSAASYVVTIPAAMSIGTNGSSKQGTVRAVLENFRYNNRLNVTVSSRNTYELVNSAPAGSKQKVFYNLYLDGGSVTVIQSSDDENSSSGENSSDKISGDSASVDEETVTVTGNRRTKLTNSNDSNSVLAFSKQSVSNATITQNIIAELDESSTPVTVAGTYTDILTFTVNFG